MEIDHALARPDEFMKQLNFSCQNACDEVALRLQVPRHVFFDPPAIARPRSTVFHTTQWFCKGYRRGWPLK